MAVYSYCNIGRGLCDDELKKYFGKMRFTEKMYKQLKKSAIFIFQQILFKKEAFLHKEFIDKNQKNIKK